ncbi:MAG: ABC transporter substrate-binding protein [Haloarculaceae archaeon]
MSNDNGDNTNGRPLSRRRFIEGIGATGLTAAFAGCGGQQATQTETTTSGAGSPGGGDGTPGGTPTATPTATPTPTPVQVKETTLQQIQELAYVTNQTLPVLPIQEKLAQSFQTTDDWKVPPKKSEKYQLYWPTEWLPRSGDWQKKSGSGDKRLTFAQWAVPQDSQYNPWNGKNFAEPRRMLFDRFMKYNLATGEYDGHAISDWSIDGTTVTLTVRDGLTWHNGDPVTATDVANQIKLDIYSGGSLGQFVAPKDKGKVSERVTATDDATVELSLVNSVNQQILLSYLQPKYLVAHDGTYGKYVKRFDNATSKDQRSKILSDLTSKTVPKPVGCGPFQFKDADTQRTLLTKYSAHPDAGNMNYKEMEYLYMPSNQKRWNALINKQTDGSATLFMPANKVKQLSKAVQITLIPRHWGMGLIFNHSKAPVKDERVRKALAHLINRKNVAKNSGAGTNSKVAVTYPSGLTGEFNNQIESGWLEGVADEFKTYGRAAKQSEKAAQLLEDAGYQKKNGTWQKNGKPLEVPIKCTSAFSDWVAALQTIVAQLKSEGIKAKAVTQSNSTYWGKSYANGDFVVAMNGWASYSHTYPYFHFNWLYESSDATDIWQVPNTFTSPVLHDHLRDGKKVDPGKLLQELSSGSN